MTFLNPGHKARSCAEYWLPCYRKTPTLSNMHRRGSCLCLGKLVVLAQAVGQVFQDVLALRWRGDDIN
jgi:hypothetical protein